MAVLYLVPMDSFLGPWRSGIYVQTRRVSTSSSVDSIFQFKASTTHRDLLNCALLQDLLDNILLIYGFSVLCLTKLAVKSGLGRIVVRALSAMPVELIVSVFVFHPSSVAVFATHLLVVKTLKAEMKWARATDLSPCHFL